MVRERLEKEEEDQRRGQNEKGGFSLHKFIQFLLSFCMIYPVP